MIQYTPMEPMVTCPWQKAITPQQTRGIMHPSPLPQTVSGIPKDRNAGQLGPTAHSIHEATTNDIYQRGLPLISTYSTIQMGTNRKPL